ncbi:hypothetical protein [Acinetobacter shaoyimingii]|uniref:Uncharacterized protein n=1 Tax=Acinetobacter shaoyimingii TaxID=2715164 RepID=A0A6G8RWT0_9GAMM|nr:hypothetical protein [Acinetobacter shaoyimingii]QIO06396.1 hypothetical protein G8E00_10745 [Acinetobacter shaoyimingii]
MSQILEFNPLDNPMQLSKIGNWLITYLSAKEELDNIQLAISYVLPRHLNDRLQPRRIVIHKSQTSSHQWHIEQIECYDSTAQKEVLIEPNTTMWQEILENLIKEFRRYDVDVTLK